MRRMAVTVCWLPNQGSSMLFLKMCQKVCVDQLDFFSLRFNWLMLYYGPTNLRSTPVTTHFNKRRAPSHESRQPHSQNIPQTPDILSVVILSFKTLWEATKSHLAYHDEVTPDSYTTHFQGSTEQEHERLIPTHPNYSKGIRLIKCNEVVH